MLFHVFIKTFTVEKSWLKIILKELEHIIQYYVLRYEMWEFLVNDSHILDNYTKSLLLHAINKIMQLGSNVFEYFKTLNFNYNTKTSYLPI
jgi:hypothetical protein